MAVSDEDKIRNWLIAVGEKFKEKDYNINIITAAAWLESAVQKILHDRVISKKYKSFKTHQEKTELAYIIGSISKQCKIDLSTIACIRNKYAHRKLIIENNGRKFRFETDFQGINDLIKNLLHKEYNEFLEKFKDIQEKFYSGDKGKVLMIMVAWTYEFVCSKRIMREKLPKASKETIYRIWN